MTESAIESGLLDGAVAEISRRSPDYLSRFPVTLSIAAERQRHPGAPAEQFHAAVAALGRRGVAITEHAGSSRIARVLLDSALDARTAEERGLPLRPCPAPAAPWLDALAEHYDRRELGGVRYVVRRRGSRPLVLVNAVGVSLGIWARFMSDPSHDFRIIAVESRSTDFLRGGVVGVSDADGDARDIAAVLEHERLGGATVLAWCNGGRIALALAAARPGLVRSLVLVATTMMGSTACGLLGSTFERDLEEVFKNVRRRAELASFFVRMLASPREPEWSAAGADDEARARLLFRLPPHGERTALLAPVATAESLIRYAQRGASDLAFAIDDALSRITAPVLLVTGSDDEVVNGELTVAALGRTGRRYTHVEIDGAGHYVNDLQYPYLLCALEGWLGGDTAIPRMVRVRVVERNR